MTGKSNIVNDIYTKEELEQVVQYLSRLPKQNHQLVYAGITEDHVLYSWFVKRIFARLQTMFNPDMRLLIGSLIDELVPLKLHSDYYLKTKGTPYRVYLIPIGVENDMSRVSEVHTVIFEEQDTYVAPENLEEKIWTRKNWLESRKTKENNALQYQQQYLSHLKTDDLECLTVENVLQWKLGSVIHWDETQLHCSDNYAEKGIKSKQALVIHTYVL